MKNCKSVKTVNVILNEFGTEQQTRNFLHSACQQKDVNINIVGNIDERITRDYNSYLSFNKETHGFKIYHSSKIILGESDVYKYLLDNPHKYIVPLGIDLIDQKYYPYIPKNIMSSPVMSFTSCIITDSQVPERGKKLCYYQN